MIHKLHCQQNKPEISNKFYLGTVEDQRCTYPSQTTAIFNSTISLSGIWVLIFKNYTWFRMYAERSFHQDQSQLSTSTPLGNIRKLRLSNHILCWISIFSTTFLPVNFVCILLCQFSPNKIFFFFEGPYASTWHLVWPFRACHVHFTTSNMRCMLHCISGNFNGRWKGNTARYATFFHLTFIDFRK